MFQFHFEFIRWLSENWRRIWNIGLRQQLFCYFSFWHLINELRKWLKSRPINSPFSAILRRRIISSDNKNSQQYQLPFGRVAGAGAFPIKYNSVETFSRDTHTPLACIQALNSNLFLSLVRRLSIVLLMLCVSSSGLFTMFRIRERTIGHVDFGSGMIVCTNLFLWPKAIH